MGVPANVLLAALEVPTHAHPKPLYKNPGAACPHVARTGDPALCELHQLGCLPSRYNTTPGAAPDPPSTWGYNIADEPGKAQFPNVGAELAKVRRLRKGKMGFVNLLETYCPADTLFSNPPAAGRNASDTVGYEEYVEAFVATVAPDLLCFDYYPYFEEWQQFPHYDRLPVATRGRSLQTKEGYVENLRVIYATAVKHGIPFWNYFGASAFQGHTVVTEAQLRFQIFASITFGSTGLLYFNTGVFPNSLRGPAAGGPTTARLWAQASRVNADVIALAPTLMQLELPSTVALLRRDTAVAEATAVLPAGSALTAISEVIGCAGITTTMAPAAVPMCRGGFAYAACPGLWSAAHSQPQKWCTGSSWDESCCVPELDLTSCLALCTGDAQGNLIPGCVAVDFDGGKPGAGASNGTCCLLDQTAAAALAASPTASAGSHHVQVATGQQWSCPAVPAAGATARGFAGEHAAVVVGADLLLGFSRHGGDGRESIIILNFDHTLSAMLDVRFRNGTLVAEVDPVTGKETVLVDEIPSLPGIQLSFDAAQARLFLVGIAT